MVETRRAPPEFLYIEIVVSNSHNTFSLSITCSVVFCSYSSLSLSHPFIFSCNAAARKALLLKASLRQ